MSACNASSTMCGRQVQDVVPSIIPVSGDLAKSHDMSKAQWPMAETDASIISIDCLFAVKIQKLKLERSLVALPTAGD